MKKLLLALCGLLFLAAGCGGSGNDPITPVVPDTYTVTFNTHGGSDVVSQTVEKNGSVVEPGAPTRDGYFFAGWFKESACVNEWIFDTDKIVRHTTIHAKWVVEQHSVTFNSMGGSEVAPQNVPEGSRVILPSPPPTMDGYVLVGWYREQTLENEWNFSLDVVADDMTLYAKWREKISYTVTFETDGGSEIAPQQVLEAENIIEPDAPTLHRFNFEGWYADQELTTAWDFETGLVVSDTTLFAKWSADESALYPGAVFIAPNGNDESGDGTMQRPYKTLRKAKSIVDVAANGKDTVYMRGGTYNVSAAEITSEDGTWMDIFDFSSNPDSGPATRSGTAAKYICYWGFPGERPIFNLSAVKPGKRVRVFYIGRHYTHFKNFEIIGTQVSVKGHTQSECFRLDGGNSNIIENVSMHDGMAIGVYIVRGMNNLILNCDAYNNFDNFSGEVGNVDGFGGHVNATSTGNVFRGCRAWYNGDDGFDLIGALSVVEIDNCWSWRNGYTTSNGNGGDGTGFKAGGYGMAALTTAEKRYFIDEAREAPRHIVKNCISYRNRLRGFYANHHLGGIEWTNNTAYNESAGFNMTNRATSDMNISGDGARADDEVGGGYGHVLTNNISFYPGTVGADIVSYNPARCTLTGNSFPSMVPAASDFISTDPEELKLPRNPDGSLPHINFLRPVPGGRLTGMGNFY